MRLVEISDTHGLHNRIDGLPDGDVLIHAGDFMNSGHDVQGHCVVQLPAWRATLQASRGLRRKS